MLWSISKLSKVVEDASQSPLIHLSPKMELAPQSQSNFLSEQELAMEHLRGFVGVKNWKLCCFSGLQPYKNAKIQIEQQSV